MLSPLIFKLDGRALRVEKKKFYQKKFDYDIAYMLSKYNPYVYPYMGKIKDYREAVEPGLYILDDNVYIKRPFTDDEKEKYSIDNVIKITPESIFKDLNNTDDYIDIDKTTASFGEEEIFKPIINSSDDMALAGMKFSIGQKNINFNAYANKFSDQATKNNGRRALTHGSSLKMDMLSRFANVFDIGVGLVFFDKKGCQNPMDKTYKKAYVIFDSDSIDLSKKEFVEITTDNVNREDDDYID